MAGRFAEGIINTYSLHFAAILFEVCITYKIYLHLDFANFVFYYLYIPVNMLDKFQLTFIGN